MISASFSIGSRMQITRQFVISIGFFDRLILILILLICSSIQAVSTLYSRGSSHQSVLKEFRQYELTIPHIAGKYYQNHGPSLTLTQEGHVQSTHLLVRAFNQSFNIPLNLNSHFYADTYLEKHYVDNDDVILHKPQNHTFSHCYYHNALPNSPTAAISTCDGISGYFTSDDEETYYIYPVDSSKRREHYILRQSDRLVPPGKCGTEDDDRPLNLDFTNLRRRKRSLSAPYDANEKSRYVELYMVADSKEFNQHLRDRSKLINRIKEIVNIVNSLYRQLNIYIALVGIEIWEDADRIIVESSADKTMNNFLLYRKQHINPHHRNDNSQLLSGQRFEDGIVGKAMKEPICTFLYSGGVSVDSSFITKVVAVTLAHEMGHNFGFEHDKEGCNCPQERCIMEAVSGLNYPTKWSQCSRDYLEKAFDTGMDYCLREVPVALYESPLCGNSFVEEGEECDCGLAEDCSSLCCNATTCQLLPNATCATGACCDKQTCQMLPAATPCRLSQTECDLTEYCSGHTEYCPTDFHIQDGATCLEGEAYCYNGKCNTYDKQCEFLWGPSGRKGHELCYTRLNQEGTGNGNCGFNWLTKTFKACSPADVFCGMLHCYHRAEKLAFWKPSLTYLLPELHITTNGGQQYFCQSAILDVGYDLPDPGLVPDGTKCGNNMMCMNQQCLTKTQLNFPSCISSNCSNHGVCNDKGQCYCDCGYSPPYCNTTGNGGSVTSGPVCISGSGFAWWVICIVVLLILCITLLIIWLAVRRRDVIRQWWREKTYWLASSVVRCVERVMKCPLRKPGAMTPVPTAPTADNVHTTRSKASSVQRSTSINRSDISGPIFQSSTIEDNKHRLVKLEKPLYENEVFKPGNKRARPPSFADVGEFPALPPRANLAPTRPTQASSSISIAPVPTRSAPLAPSAAKYKMPPSRPAPLHASHTPVSAHHVSVSQPTPSASVSAPRTTSASYITSPQRTDVNSTNVSVRFHNGVVRQPSKVSELASKFGQAKPLSSAPHSKC